MSKTREPTISFSSGLEPTGELLAMARESGERHGRSPATIMNP